VNVRAADAAVGPEFAKGFAVVPRSIGGEAYGLADSRQSSATPARSQGVLEGQFRFDVDEAAGHDKVLGDPITAPLLEGLDLVLRGAIKLLACDVLVDFRRAFAVRTVGAAKISRVGSMSGSFSVRFGSRARTGVRTVEPARGTLGAAAKLLAVPVVKTSTLPLPLAGGTLTKRLTIPITKRLTIPITKRLTIPITKRLTIPITKTTTLTIRTTLTVTVGLTVAFTGRTLTIRTTLTVTVGLTVAVSKTTTLTSTLTRRTLTKRPTLTVTVGLTVAFTGRTLTIRTTLTVAKWLTVPIAEPTALTVTKRLTIPVTRAVVPCPEAARISSRVVVRTERAAIFAVSAEVAAIAAAVLSHDGFLLLRAPG
jgi:hypothetical protein